MYFLKIHEKSERSHGNEEAEHQSQGQAFLPHLGHLVFQVRAS